MPVVRALLHIPIYPPLFAAAFVLSRYVGSFEFGHVLIRPVIAICFLVCTVQLVGYATTRNAHVAAFVAALLFGLLVDVATAAIAVVVANVPPLVGLVQRRRLGRADWRGTTVALTVIGAITLGLSIGPAIERGRYMSPATGLVGIAGSVAAAPEAPDVYVVMLDGYPRADTLQSEFAFDNAPFLRSMASLGFEVAARSHSNYNLTLLTLTSFWNMAHVSDVVGEPPGFYFHAAALVQHINGGTGLAALRQAGYHVVSVPSGLTQTSIFIADDYGDTGQINSFEVSLLRAGAMPRLLPGVQRAWLLQQQRDRIEAQLNSLVTIADRPAERPRFVFAHLMSPHAPIVFNADGSAQDTDCIPESCGVWDEVRGPDANRAMLGQLTHLNTLVLEAVTELIERSHRPPVVIVFSDHGSRHDLENRDEMLRNLFMSYTPDRPGLFPDDSSPINVIARLMNGYAGSSITLATEEAYQADYRTLDTVGYFPLEPWPIP
jgi:hypothetical protein